MSGGSKTFQPASAQMRYWLLVVQKKEHSGLDEEQTGDSHTKYQGRINCLVLIRTFSCYRAFMYEYCFRKESYNGVYVDRNIDIERN